MKKILGISLMTNNPESTRANFLPSLKNLSELIPVAEVLINFQDYEPEDIESIVSEIRDIGFDCKYAINSYEKLSRDLVPFLQIRDDTMVISPDLLYYVSVDDDFIFGGMSPVIGKTSGRQYLEILHYMVHYPKCGIVMTGSTLIKNPPVGYIGIGLKDIHTYVSTGMGLFMKNIYSETGSYYGMKEALKLLGGRDEAIASLARVANGYYVALSGSTRVRSAEKNILLTREENVEYHRYCSPEVLDNNVGKFIKENYSPDYDWVDSYMNHCTYSKYLEAGGLDVRDPKVRESLLGYYPNMQDADNYKSNEDLISEIYETLNCSK